MKQDLDTAPAGAVAAPLPWWGRALAGGALAALPVIVIGLIVLMVAPGWVQNLTAMALINLMIVVGLQIYSGNSGIVHLGHSAFVGLGAYGMAILTTPLVMKKLSIPNAPFGLAGVELHWLPGAALALLVVGVIAWISARVIARLSGIAATIVSLAFLMVIHSVFLHWPALFKGNQGFFGIPKLIGLPELLLAACAVILIARLFRESPGGLQLRASAQDQKAADAIGIDSRALRRHAWILSALVCGLAGILFAVFSGTISPRLFFFQQVMLTLAMLILGGMASVSGAVAGAVILSLVLELIRNIESGVTIGGVTTPALLGLSGVALGMVIVLCMALRPQGLLGHREADDFLEKWRVSRTPGRNDRRDENATR
ncbi:branched-chain amino acid ABC transporter permease [Gemmobacter serpentinus]|uniref:branched-chain amino acid ABC transporter permease n=1 Tax=Gemmobacter serpentinus TaxID=2652247 RepID=UPI00124C317B|nr:branched-chain amino acid ABC transporter permease [Gemmobacter serpentinus]